MFNLTKQSQIGKKPWWKRRLESQVKELNKDLQRLNALLESRKMKKKHQDNLLKIKDKRGDLPKKESENF